MADQVPINFAIPNETIIASYDYTDIADGEGKVIYYLYTAYDTATTALVYRLGREQPATHEEVSGAYTSGPDLGSTGGADAEFNFNTGTFTVPQIMKGIAVLTCGIYGAVNGGHITAKIFHYNGSSETQLGATFTSETFSGPNYKNINVLFTIPKTNFGIGDSIRLEIVTVTDAGGTVVIGADPQNKAGEEIDPATAGRTTISTLRIPFEIQN